MQLRNLLINYSKEYKKLKDELVAKSRPSSYVTYVYHMGKNIYAFTGSPSAEKKVDYAALGYVWETCDVIKDYNNEVQEEFKFKVKQLDERWYRELRYEYLELNDITFEIVYARAYAYNHAGGFDDIASAMYGFADMANKIILANK